jgi:alkaline phosphatase D
MALARENYTARVDLRGLPAGQRVYYRVRFQDLVHESALSEPVSGSLMVPASAQQGQARDITFAFSGDEAGQGWGINEQWGGYRVYESMRPLPSISSSIPATRSMPTAPSRPR